MEYNIDLGLYSGIFAVPNCIVDKYLKLCNGDTLKVLMVLLRNSGQDLSVAEIAALSNLSSAQVKDALHFWSDLGILGEGGSEIVLDNQVYEEELAPAPQTEPLTSINKEAETPQPTPVSTAKQQSVVGNTVRLSNAPHRPAREEAVQRMQQSAELRMLVQETARILEKNQDSNILCTMVMLYDWCGMAADLLLMIVQYCKSIGFTDMRRIEKMALEFIDKGIDTHEKADAYILSKSEDHKNENLVRSAFGIDGRRLSAKESEYIRIWFREFGMTIEIIQIAYEQGVNNTAKLSFAYINKILSNWHEQDIHTPEAALENVSSGGKRKKKTGSTRKYADTTYNIDEIDHDSLYNTPKL